MHVIFQFDMRVSAPTKTTTGIVLECLGVKVERSAGSVQRALEEALTEYAHQLRAPLLKEARDARKRTVAEEAIMRTLMDKEYEPEAEEEAPDHSHGILPETFYAEPKSAGILMSTTAAAPTAVVEIPLFTPKNVLDGPDTPFEP